MHSERAPPPVPVKSFVKIVFNVGAPVARAVTAHTARIAATGMNEANVLTRMSNLLAKTNPTVRSPSKAVKRRENRLTARMQIPSNQNLVGEKK
jgi:hypothetical protein